MLVHLLRSAPPARRCLPLALLLCLGAIPACDGAGSDEAPLDSAGAASDGEPTATPSGGAASGGAAAGDAAGGAAATSGGGSNGGGGDGGEPSLPPCDSPEPVGGPDSGMLRCANGWVRRLAPGTCADARVESASWPSEDCPDSAYPHWNACFSGPYGSMYCAAGCVEDADCAPDEACACGEEIGQCVPASCRSADDCGPDEACVLTRYVDCPSWPGAALRCQSPEDVCLHDDDCDQPGRPYWFCGTEAGEAACIEIYPP